MPKYKLNSGEVIDTSNFSEEEENNWLFDNTDNIDLNYDFQNGAAGTDASATPVNNPASNGDSISEDGLSDGVNSYDDARARRIKEGRDYNFYKNNPREQRPRETDEAYQERIANTLDPLYTEFQEQEDLGFFEGIMAAENNRREGAPMPGDNPEEYADRKLEAKRGYTVDKSGKQVSLASGEDYKYYGTTDKEIAENIIIDEELEEEFQNMRYNSLEDNSFVDSYYNTAELNELGVNVSDFQGFLNVNEFSKDFENDLKEGVYSGDSSSDASISKELALSDMLNAYMYQQDERTNKRLDLSEIIKGNKTIEALKEPHKVTNFDYKKLQAYENNNFYNLKAKNDKDKAKRLEEKNKRIGVVPTNLAKDNIIYDIAEKTFIGAADAALDSLYWVADLAGYDTFAKRGRNSMRLAEMGDELGALDYLSVEGLGLEVDGKTYIKDAKGNISNITDGFNIYDTMPAAQVEAISKKIDQDGTEMKDWNLRGGVRMTAGVIGNIIFQLFGQKGVGVGMKQGGKLLAKGLATARGYKTVAQSAKAYRLSSFNYFYGGVPKAVAKVLTPERVNAAVFQSLYGASVGYENTIRAAKKAGLSDAEAEDLATIAQSDMALLYAVTGPINPRVNAMKALDKLVSKSGVIGKLVNDYAKNGVRKEAAKGFKESLANVARGAKSFGIAFGEEGFKEVIQENIQQAGEYLLVNEGINKEVGFDLMKNTYSMKDIIDTTVLSFAAGGLLGGTTTVKTGFKQNPYKRLESLFYVGQDIEGSKKRYAEMVKSGVATQEQVDAIIFDAEAAVESESKMPPWIIQQTPEKFVEIARAQKELNNLKNKKKNYLDSFASGIDEQIKAKQKEIQTLTDAAAKIVIEKEAAIVKKILDKKGTKVENGIDGNNQRVVVFNTTAELKKADKNANLKADAYFDAATGQIVINLERAAKTQAVSAASHELLHKILSAEFTSNDEILKIVEEFKTILKDTRTVYANSKTGKTVYVLEAIEARLAGYPKGYIEQNPDEWLTAFSDMVAKGEVDFDSIGESNWVKIGRAIVDVFKGKGFTKIEFKTGQDVFDFIRDYQSSIKSGKISRKSSIRLKRGEKTSSTGTKLSKSRKLTEAEEDRMEAIDEEIGEISDELMQGFIDQDTHDKRIAKLEEEYENIENPPKVEAEPKPKVKRKAKSPNTKEADLKKEKVLIGDAINKMIPENMTLAEWPSVAGKIVEAFQKGMLLPLFRKQIAKMGIVADNIYGNTVQEFYDTTIGVQFIKNILNFKPKTKDNPQGNNDFAGYIIGSSFGLNNRIKEALAELKKGRELNEASDVSTTKGIAAEESSNEVKEKPKYRSLVEANVVPGEVVDAIEAKLKIILRTLKARMDAPITGNRTVTPVIGEIIAEMGTQADIDLKTAMGGKKDLKLRKFLLKTKKAVLQNMTTTWLMGKDGEGGIPQAIDKKVDGKWLSYPDWVGKEVDREKTSTNLAGRTDGKLLVRRHPNIVNYFKVDEVIDDDTYLSQFLTETGNPIRGRKEALAKAMAAEMSIEIFNAKLVDPDSEISEAFKNNQKAKSVLLAENLVEQIARDSERGSVKYSITSGNPAINRVGLSLEKYLKQKYPTLLVKDLFYGQLNLQALRTRDKNVDGMLATLEGLFIDEAFINKTKTDDSKKKAEKFKLAGNEDLGTYLNNRVTNAAGDIANMFGVNPKDISFRNPSSNLITEVDRGLENLLVSLIEQKGKAEGINSFIRMVQPGMAAGTGQSIYGNNKGFNAFLNKLAKGNTDNAKLIKSAIEEAGLTLKENKNKKGFTFYSKEGKTTSILVQEANAPDIKSLIEKLIFDVKIKERNKLSEDSAETFLGLVDQLKKLTNKPKGGISPLAATVILNSQSKSMRSAAKTLGKIMFFYRGDGQTAADYTFEHGTPTKQLLMAAAAYINGYGVTEKQLKSIVEKSNITILPKNIAKAIDFLYQYKFPNADSLAKTNPGFDRYFNDYVSNLYKGFTSESLINLQKKYTNSKVNILKVDKQLSKSLASPSYTRNINAQKAIENGKSYSYSTTPKGISVFDFDDTLARTKSNVLYVMPGGPSKVTEKEFSNLSKQEKVYYHGTSAVVDQKFVNKEIVKDFPEGASSFSVQMQGLGKHYTKSLDNAKSFIDHRNREDNTGTVAAVSISANNPKQFKTYQDLLNDIKSTVKNKDISISERNKEYLNILKSEGFDSIIYKEGPSYNPGKKSLMAEAVIPFNSTKKLIGSADYNQRNEGIVQGSAVAVKQGKLNAAQFAAKSEAMLEQGAEFDFSEFSKVMKGELGPLFSEAQKKEGKYTNKDIFVLTARPANSAKAIHEFLKSEGLNIPLKNITGLGNGSPQAKADWMVGKIAEGYNDFYFADDHMGNVKAVGKALKGKGVKGQTELSIVDFKNQPKAVRDILNTFDVKGKTQRSRVKFSNSMNKTMNDMLERASGIPSRKRLTRVEASELGKRKGRFKLWMPSTLDDFRGLTSFTFAGKGRQGDADQKFFEDFLIKPYFRGVGNIERAKQSLKNGFTALNKQFKPVLKKLGKKIPGMAYTHDQALRIYLWNKAGYEIPGLTRKQERQLVKFIENDADLLAYANGALRVSQRKQWSKPDDYWNAQTILSDLNNFTEKAGRKEYIQEFIQNVDLIFSENNLNKIEAIYGKDHRQALENIIERMKSGVNRTQRSSANKNENAFNTWLNNSIGAIMFFNRRSALLQLLSTVNFVNWSDNNPMKAAAAFANQKQFWADFAMIFNSPKLKQRRSGLNTDVNAAEIASAVTGAKDKATAALSYLLKIGFTPTQMVDSFAIAAGGATFYRNRLNTYLGEVDADGKKVYTEKQAEEKAWEDFSETSDPIQQSGDPALISSDQAGTLGRVVLNFMNTPIQLNRTIKKSFLDLVNRRRTPGMTQAQSDFSNVSKMIYYGFIQNAIFSTLQAGLFALIPGFNDDDEEKTEEQLQAEKDNKWMYTLNSMIDTTLKGGFGIPGAVVSTIKNVIIEWKKQNDRGFMADDSKTLLAFLNLSPAVGSKGRKIVSGIKTLRYEEGVIDERGFDVTIDGKFNLSPAWNAAGNLVEGAINIPLARVVDEVNSIVEALDSRNTVYQRIALALGWKSWAVGAKNEENDLIKVVAKYRKKLDNKEKRRKEKAKEKLEEMKAEARANK